MIIFTSLVALSIILLPKSSSVSDWDYSDQDHDEEDNYYQKTAFDGGDEILHVILLLLMTLMI